MPPAAKRAPEYYPPLPLVLSLIDTALDRDEAFSARWPVGELRKVREALEYVIFALLEFRLRNVQPHYQKFFLNLYDVIPPKDVTVLSLNYDIIADNAMAAIPTDEDHPALPDYRCDIATEAYRQAPKRGALLKLHGSLNWLYCPNCNRLELGMATRGLRTAKMLRELYESARAAENVGKKYGGYNNLETKYEGHDSTPCKDCAAPLRAVLITPTHRKDYRNPHIGRVWYQAARALRESERAIFVGYSMPEDDVEVIYLFKRGLGELTPRAITVVEYTAGVATALDEHPVGLRYRALFGNEIDWRTDGFEGWMYHATRERFAPPPARTRRSSPAKASRRRTRASAVAS